MKKAFENLIDNCSSLNGNCPGLRGNCSGLRGDCSNILETIQKYESVVNELIHRLEDLNSDNAPFGLYNKSIDASGQYFNEQHTYEDIPNGLTIKKVEQQIVKDSLMKYRRILSDMNAESDLAQSLIVKIDLAFKNY